MLNQGIKITIFCLLISLCVSEKQTNFNGSLVLETCDDCCLKNYRAVHDFLLRDLHFYGERITFKYIDGQKPVLTVYTKNGTKLRKIDISAFDRIEIRKTVESYGLTASPGMTKLEMDIGVNDEVASFTEAEL